MLYLTGAGFYKKKSLHCLICGLQRQFKQFKLFKYVKCLIKVFKRLKGRQFKQSKCLKCLNCLTREKGHSLNSLGVERFGAAVFVLSCQKGQKHVVTG